MERTSKSLAVRQDRYAESRAIPRSREESAVPTRSEATEIQSNSESSFVDLLGVGSRRFDESCTKDENKRGDATKNEKQFYQFQPSTTKKSETRKRY